MKIQGVIFWTLIAASFVANATWWKVSWFKFAGYMLIGIIAFGFLLSIGFKILGKSKEEDAFILPDAMAKTMKMIALQTQYEATILSLFFMVLGGTGFVIYYLFFVDASWATKGFLVFNGICGLVLMLSMLVTNYQQYVLFKQANKPLQELLNTQTSDIILKGEIDMIDTEQENMKGGNQDG